MFNELLPGVGMVGGFQVVEDLSMTEPGEPYEVRRSWKERLFSRPWRPMRATRTLVPQVPSRKVILFGQKIIAHPSVVKEIKRQLAG